MANDTASANKFSGFVQFKVNWPITIFYVTVSFLQYVFSRLVIEKYAGCEWAHGIFAFLFVLVTGYYLWERPITRILEAVGDRVGSVLKKYPALWFGIRVIIEIAILGLVFYWIGVHFKSLQGKDYSWLLKILKWVFAIDSALAFLAFYGTKKTQGDIRELVDSSFKNIEKLIQRERITEVFILTSVISVILKIALIAVIVAGIVGAIGIVGGILIIILPYFILSVLVTAFFITGSFAATARYWQWLLTEPPKAVVRFIFKVKTDQVRCYHCGRIIPLVGTYSCPSCKFTFKGHYFNWCPNCYTRFGYVNCECGLSRKRPFLL